MANKVLYIKADAKLEGESRTFSVSDRFIEVYKQRHPEDEVIELDLYKEGIGFLPVGRLEELHRPKPGEGRGHPILKYALQFQEADKYVIAEPLWNLGVPAILKAYIDYVCVNGITFKYTAAGPVGLSAGKKAVNITTRGGKYSEGRFKDQEMCDKYLRNIFSFMGVSDFSTIAVDELDVIGVDTSAVLKEARLKAEALANVF